jgi:uncharacterized membrane protein
MKLKQKQHGLTFFGLLIVGVLLAFAGVTLARMVPTYIEFLAVQKAVQSASNGSTVAEVRALFDKAAQIDDITSISGKDLEVGKEGNRVVVSFNYTREMPLMGPAYLVMKYAGSSE